METNGHALVMYAACPVALGNYLQLLISNYIECRPDFAHVHQGDACICNKLLWFTKKRKKDFENKYFVYSPLALLMLEPGQFAFVVAREDAIETNVLVKNKINWYEIALLVLQYLYK